MQACMHPQEVKILTMAGRAKNQTYLDMKYVCKEDPLVVLLPFLLLKQRMLGMHVII